MTSRSLQASYQAATTAQSSHGGHVYSFGNNTVSENEFSEEDGESYELRPRGRERLRRSASRDRMDDIVYLVRDIKEGDTLNAISLQYFCSVADIKRANNLLTEQDFFALRSIRIPVKKFSVLTETHEGNTLKSTTLAGVDPQAPPYDGGTDSSSSSSSTDFLQEKDKDIEQLVKSAEPARGSLNEVVSSLNLNHQRGPGDLEQRRLQAPPHKDPYYGADWGMRWWMAVAIMLVVGIVTPVFYLLYYEVLMKGDVSHHGTTVSHITPQTHVNAGVQHDKS